MADRIAVIKDGVLQAYGPPGELYDKPRTLFIAGFVGNPPMNIWDTEVVRDDDVYHARNKDLDLVLPPDRGEKAVGRGGVLLGIRAEDISISDAGIAGEVYVAEPLGRDDLLNIHIGDVNVHVLADPGLGLRIGDTVHLGFNTHKVQFFDPGTEKSLLWTA